MKKREFNAALKSITVGRGAAARLSVERARNLDDATKHAMVEHIVSNRAPVAACLLSEATDRSWFQSMGYMYPFERGGYAFVGRQGHQLGAQYA